MTVKQAEIEWRGRALKDEPKWMQSRGQNSSCLKVRERVGRAVLEVSEAGFVLPELH